jgi:phage terminase small subunit
MRIAGLGVVAHAGAAGVQGMLKATSRRLTLQQLKLVDAYIANGGKDQNAAARAAGYTESGARNIWRTFAKVQVVEEIERRWDEAMTAREALHRIGKHAREGEPQISIKALELLAKHHKLLTDKQELTGADGEPISVTFNLSPTAK